MRDLLSMGAPTTAPAGGWKPPAVLPDLSEITRIGFDTETTGKNPFKDVPVGFSIAWRTDSLNKLYLPVGHSEGNLDRDVVKSWLAANLRRKHIVGSNTKFDVHMCKNWGLDLEALEVKTGDIAFNGALLVDKRGAGLGLDTLGTLYVGRGKMPFQGDMNRMADYPSWMVAPYAEEDAGLALEVEESTLPLLSREGLMRVLALEEDLVYFVCEIERNGCRVNVPKLELWRREVRDEYEALAMELYRKSGMLVNPNSGDSIMDFLKVIGVEPPEAKTASGKTSFSESLLLGLKDPYVEKLVNMRRLESLLSKYLDKFHDGLEGDLLRSQFHQLKSDEFGTISGRFSSSGGGDTARGYNFNAQQVITADKQQKDMGDHHIIRELIVPDNGFEFWACDAAQIEYRLFGHFSNAPKIIEAYRNDPTTNFHKLVMAMIVPFVPDIPYKHVKNVNFARLYGAGLHKIALMLGVSDEKAAEYLTPYDRVFPEAKSLGKRYMDEAKDRGYVSTILGRRARLGPHDKIHSAVNRVIQGTAADIMKMKLRRVYRERKTLGIHKLRQTVHDEQCGDKDPDPKYTALIQECFNEQEANLNVPILWDLATGTNWKECK